MKGCHPRVDMRNSEPVTLHYTPFPCLSLDPYLAQTRAPSVRPTVIEPRHTMLPPITPLSRDLEARARVTVSLTFVGAMTVGETSYGFETSTAVLYALSSRRAGAARDGVSRLYRHVSLRSGQPERCSRRAYLGFARAPTATGSLGSSYVQESVPGGYTGDSSPSPVTFARECGR